MINSRNRLPRKAYLGLVVPAIAFAGVGIGSTVSADAADPVAAMSASPNPLTYDDVTVGQSKDATVVLSSVGTADVTVADVANVGRDQDNFSLVSDACSGHVLAPGEMCPVVLRFAPKSPQTKVTNIRFRSTNACARYVNVAGGGRTAAAGATASVRADDCSIVASTVTTTTSAPPVTTTAPGGSVVAPSPTVTTPGTTVTAAGAASSSPGATTAAPAGTAGTTAGVTATSPKVCRSRRTIAFNVKPQAGTTLAKVSVRVNDKLAKVFTKPKGGKLKTQLKLTGQPRTRVKVVIRTTTTSGKVASRTQFFVTCVPKSQSAR